MMKLCEAAIKKRRGRRDYGIHEHMLASSSSEKSEDDSDEDDENNYRRRIIIASCPHKNDFDFDHDDDDDCQQLMKSNNKVSKELHPIGSNVNTIMVLQQHYI